MSFLNHNVKNTTDNKNDLLKEVYEGFDKYGKIVDPGRWQGVDLDKRIQMWELINTTVYMPIPETAQELEDVTLADQPWSEAQFKERMNNEPVNPGETYKYWPWNKFNNENDDYVRHNHKFSHTYMERYASKINKPKWVVDQLNKNQGSRQVYFPVWREEDDANHVTEGNRVPCSLGYLFLLREGKLHITYYIRSCDLLRHFRNDVYLTARLAQWVRDHLRYDDVKMGHINIHIGSLHLFTTDKYALEKREKMKFDGLTILK